MISLDLISISPDSSYIDALAAVDKGGMGLCLVIGDDGLLVGILTDGDIRRALLSGSELDGSITPAITLQPITVSQADSRVAVLEVMQARGLGAVPVVAESRVVGLHTLQEIIGTESRDNWAVIMAGGRGTRLGSLTNNTPKPMLKVAGRPILERIILHLVGSGISRIALSVNYKSGIIEDHFGDGSRLGCQIEYLREAPDNPLGTAGSLSLLSEAGIEPTEPFVLLNGDIMSHFSLAGLFDAHEVGGYSVTIGGTQHEYSVPFGVLEQSESGQLITIEEKPTLSWSVGAGVYVLNPEIPGLIRRQEPLDMPTLCSILLKRGHRVGVHDLESDWIDVGNPKDLARARGEST